MTRDEVFEFFRRLAEDDPSPETELEFGNVYQLLVAVVLSAQATDVGVNKATRALFREVRTPQQMIALGEEGLKAHIKTIGLFNSKAKNVVALSERLVAEHGGERQQDPHPGRIERAGLIDRGERANCEQQRIPGQKRRHHQPCFAEDDQEQDQVDPDVVVGDELGEMLV